MNALMEQAARLQDEGLTQKKIGERIGRCQATVRKYLLQTGHRTRTGAGVIDKDPGLLEQMKNMRSKDNLLYKEIGEKIGLSASRISQILQPFDLPRPQRSFYRGNKRHPQNRTLRRMIPQTESQRQVAVKMKRLADIDWSKRWHCGILKSEYPICLTMGCYFHNYCPNYKGLLATHEKPVFEMTRITP